MSRFAAIIAMLKNDEASIERHEQEAVDRFRIMKDVIRDIADNAEANGRAWASERAKRALAETEEWYI